MSANLNSTVRMYAASQPGETLTVGFRLWHSLDYTDLFDFASALIDLADIDLSDVPPTTMTEALEKYLKRDKPGAFDLLEEYLPDIGDLEEYLLEALGAQQDLLGDKLEQIFETSEIEHYKKLPKGTILALTPLYKGPSSDFVKLPDDYYLYEADGKLLKSKDGFNLWYDLLFVYIRSDCRTQGQTLDPSLLASKLGGNITMFGGAGGKGGIRADGELYELHAVWRLWSTRLHQLNSDVFPYLCGCQSCYTYASNADWQQFCPQKFWSGSYFSGMQVAVWSPCGARDGYETFAEKYGIGHDFTYIDLNQYGNFEGVPGQIANFQTDRDSPESPWLHWTPPEGDVLNDSFSCGDFYLYKLTAAIRGQDHKALAWDFSASSTVNVKYIDAMLPYTQVFWRSEEYQPGEPGSWQPPEAPGGGGVIPVIAAGTILADLFNIKIKEKRQ